MPGSLDDAVAAVWARKRGSTLERVELIERAARQLEAGVVEEELRARAEVDAHKMAGSLGSFGFTEASRLAALLEARLKGPSGAPAAGTVEIVGRLRRELDEPAPDAA